MWHDDGHIAMVELTVKNLILELIEGARADYNADRYDEALATCQRIKTLCRDNFIPTTNVDTEIKRIQDEKDERQLDTLWDQKRLENLKW